MSSLQASMGHQAYIVYLGYNSTSCHVGLLGDYISNLQEKTFTIARSKAGRLEPAISVASP